MTATKKTDSLGRSRKAGQSLGSKPVPKASGRTIDKATIPRSMIKDKHSIYRWGVVCDALNSLGTGSPEDVEAIARNCECYSLYMQSVQRILKDGAMLATKTGVQRHPMLSTRRECVVEMKRFDSDFGLTPAARARLSPERPEMDELELLMFDSK